MFLYLQSRVSNYAFIKKMITQIKKVVSRPNELKLSLNNVLLIEGNGRNVGKTTLGCKLITKLSKDHKVVAIKVSPHFHQLTGSVIVLEEPGSIVIASEQDKDSGKDSSRYLNAGASEVFYVQCMSEGLVTLSLWLKDNINPEIPVVCESGGLGRIVRPGYNILIMSGIGEQSFKSDFETIYNNDHPENVDTNINWQNQIWQK